MSAIGTHEHALGLLEQMLLVRRFEEKCAEQYQQTKIRGFLHLYIGEEAVCVGSLASLDADDNVLATYREHGHAIVRGIPPGSVMAEMYGKANGCSRGRGGSMHLFSSALRFFGGHGIVGGSLPVAVGLALADKMQNRTRVTACFFGEGAMDEGEFHESLNLAALWKLPVLFLCENNLYAMGTYLDRHEAETDLCKKPAAHGIPSEKVDGMDVLAVERATAYAAAQVREGMGPRFLEFQTYRFRAHSMFDAEHYREKAEAEKWRERDPITRFSARLRAEGMLDDAALQAMETRVLEVVRKAVDEAEAGPWEPIEDLTRDVYTPREASR